MSHWPGARTLGVVIAGMTLGAPGPLFPQAAYTPEIARDQLGTLLRDMEEWHGLAISGYGQSAWSLIGERNGAPPTLYALDEATAGSVVRLELRTSGAAGGDEAGYRVHMRDPGGEDTFDLHLHPEDAGPGHRLVLCPGTEPGAAGPVGCLNIHGGDSIRSFEAAWSSNGELRWLVAYRNARFQPDSVLGVGRAGGDRTFERVVLSLSGGISYGSYQAGVNWAMIDMLKRLKYGGLSQRADLHDFANLSLAATTGASAGNINALFSALEWCDASFIPPERSLFFRTWANIGFTQLLADAPYRDHSASRDTLGNPVPDSALFTRRFFKAVPFASVAAKLTELSEGRARSPADCTVPVGVTLTRLRPGSLPLGLPPYQIDIDTQRYTTIYMVQGEPTETGGTRVAFARPDPGLVEDRTLGKWMLLHTEDPDAGLPVNTVLGLVEAASAYPVAFAPITLAYEDDQPDACVQRRGDLCVRQAQFMDGGVFDNNPLAVAFSLLRSNQVLDDPTDVRAGLRHLSDLLLNRVFYIDPGRTRGALRQLEISQAEEQVFGLDALLEMIKGGIPTARKYELQSVARFGSIVDQSWIRVTDRVAPVFGQTLGAFGAFLGRPLRVHDFYVGAYDGMRMVASEALCNPMANPVIGFAPAPAVAEGGPSAFGGVDPAAVEDCLGAALDSLINAWDSIPAHGRLIMSDVLARDFPDLEPTVRKEAPGAYEDDAHLRIAAATLEAAEAMRTTAQDSTACVRVRRIFDQLLCKEGIGAASAVLHPHLQALGTTTGKGNPACRRDVAAAGIMAPECTADDWFVDFVEAPGEQMSVFVERAMRQLWRVQNTYDPAESSSAETIVELPEFYYRSLVEPQYRGLSWLPRLLHTLPANPEKKAWPLYVMPEEISALSQSNGWRLQIAKQAGWDLGHSWVAPITAAYQVGFGAAEGQQVEGRLGVARKGTGLFLPRWGVNGIWGWDFENEEQFWGVQLDLYLAAGKFHIGPRWIDTAARGFDMAPRQVTFGLSDVSGMIYWLARLGIF